MRTRGMPRRWIAVLLSLLSSGLGHVYLGDTSRGLLWFVGPHLWTVGLAYAMPRVGALIGFGLFLVAWIVPPFLAWIAAAWEVTRRRLPAEAAPTARVLVIGLVFFTSARGLQLILHDRVIASFKIPSSSMTPSIFVGDRVFIDQVVYRFREPRRGEVVVFRSPEDLTTTMVKRVVALPGDILEIRQGRPWINGWPIPSCSVGPWEFVDTDGLAHAGEVVLEYLGDHAYVTFYESSQALGPPRNTGPFPVGPGEVWVLGDNRVRAHDSPRWFSGRGGGVPRGLVVGRATLVWLGLVDGSIVASRIGVDLTRPDLAGAMSALSVEFERCVRHRPPITVPPLLRP